MLTQEQKVTVQKVLNRDRTIVSYPRPQKVQEVGAAGMALAGTVLKSKAGTELAKGVSKGIQNRTTPRERNIKMGSFSYSSKPRMESDLDYYLGAIQEIEPVTTGLTLGGAAAIAGKTLFKVYIAAMLIKLAKDVFKVQFTKIGRQCKDYPGGEKGICMMRAKMKAKEAEMAKLNAGVEKCSKDKDPEACRRKVSGRMDAIKKEVAYMQKRLGELRRAPIVH